MKKIILALILAICLVSFVAAETMILRPNGQGFYRDWANTGCASGASEWQCVDENPANAADYLSTNAASRGETFAFSDINLNNDAIQINSLTLYFYGKRYANNRYQIQPLIRANGVNYAGSVKTLGLNYAYVAQVYTTNPATGKMWTVAEVNALEAGMISYSKNQGGYIAQVYATIDYTMRDSCMDSDGGDFPILFGTVSGYANGSQYSFSDYCINSWNVFEYFCSGTYMNGASRICGIEGYGNAYCSGNRVYKDFTDYFCAIGACDSSTNPVLQEDCDSQDGYIGDNFCSNGNIYKNYRDYFCISGGCSYNEEARLQETCQYGCTGEVCDAAPPRQMPDLRTNISFSPNSAYEGETVGVIVNTENLGEGEAGNSVTRVIYSSATQDFETGILLPNGVKTNYFTYVCGVSDVTFNAIADADNVVSESDEANNAQSQVLHCMPKPSLPDLNVKRLAYYISSFEMNGSIIKYAMVNITISNVGFANAAKSVARVSGLSTFDYPVPALAVGQESFFQHYEPCDVSHSLTVTADANSQIVEVTEANNQRTISLNCV